MSGPDDRVAQIQKSSEYDGRSPTPTQYLHNAIQAEDLPVCIDGGIWTTSVRSVESSDKIAP
jgi:hypothetical protein